MYKLWPRQAQFTSILSNYLQLWPWLSIYLNKCLKWHFYSSRRTVVPKWFWNPNINVQIMARTSSIYDHFIKWPSTVTLTFNLPEQMLQMALLLLKENNCAKWFWNPYINVQWPGQAQFMTILSNNLQLWPWPSTYLNKSKWHFYSSPRTTVPNDFEIHAYI